MFIRAEQAKTSDRGLTPAFVADRMNPGRGLQSFPLVAVLSVGADGAAFFIQLDGKPSNSTDSQPENRPIVGRKTVRTSAGKPSTNLLIHNQHNTEIADVTTSSPNLQ